MSKKKFLLPILAGMAVIIGLGAFMKKENAPEASGIQFFKGSWAEALQKASAENKPIFLDIYATWCGPCKKLKRETFVDKQVAKYYNQHFINVTLDGEKGDGAVLAKQYRIPGYPTLIIFNSGGKPILSTAGFLPAEEFLRFGKDAMTKMK